MSTALIYVRWMFRHPDEPTWTEDVMFMSYRVKDSKGRLVVGYKLAHARIRAHGHQVTMNGTPCDSLAINIYYGVVYKASGHTQPVLSYPIEPRSYHAGHIRLHADPC